jgi:hypothetical protein
MKYRHEQNKDKPYIDWRLPENRKEGFLLWLDWRMKYNDLDHYMVANTYRDSVGNKSPTKLSMTEEQTLWYCLLYGCTYQTEMAWVLYYNFPDFWNVDIEEMQKWNVANLEKQLYAKDTKYNKGRIADQVKSMQEIIGPYGSIKKWIENQLVDDENQSFVNMYNETSRLHKFGRMTSWLFTQALFETANIPVRPDTMLCTDPSSWSVRSGLCYLYNRDDIIEAKTKTTLSKDDMAFVATKEKDLFSEAYDYISKENKPIFSNFLLESQLCQYKKLMLGGDYAGHSSGDHYSRGCKLRERWKGEVNFDAFFEDAIMKHHELVRGKRENKPLRYLCQKTGQMINMHKDYDYMPNMYLEIGIDPEWLFDETNNNLIENKIDIYKNNAYEKIGIESFMV